MSSEQRVMLKDLLKMPSCPVNPLYPAADQLPPCSHGYLKATLAAIAGGHPQSHIDNLLPENFRPSS